MSVGFAPDVFGGTRRQIESAEALAELQTFQREGVYLTLTANIALAAIQEASLRGQIAATRRLIGIQTRLLEILRRQYQSGQIAQIDVVAQETAVAQARILLPPLEKQLAQQRDLLAFLTGRFPERRGRRNLSAWIISSAAQAASFVCRRISSASVRTFAPRKPTCVRPMRRSASRSRTACRRSP